MEGYIENGYEEIEKRYHDFFKNTNTRIAQYVIIGKKSEKFAPIELEVCVSKKLPDTIKSEVENLYKPLLKGHGDTI